ncbi:hypothetical protein [Litorilituus lipolyticus]|uniref:Lipoprotein n=1 Tax=Litorilituus lipolyticus TaxID=2491017 RepID=A0A502KU17_9GAMM|nr:hypothetical protein [Litorilituus lipolyticus]TPH15022.1 hypothetical protein EPA86_09375 [Litorilituus lipolyticus]
MSKLIYKYLRHDYHLLSKKVLCGLILLLLSACHITPKTIDPVFSYSSYYLWLKTLTQAELMTEIDKQKQFSQSQKDLNSSIKLMLSHSLPSSPIYQPYQAKTMLNQYTISSANFGNEANLAFLLLLKDQLNAQLLLIEKHKLKQQKSLKKIKQQQQEITQLSFQLELLSLKLEQLKEIEKSINQHN